MMFACVGCSSSWFIGFTGGEQKGHDTNAQSAHGEHVLNLFGQNPSGDRTLRYSPTYGNNNYSANHMFSLCCVSGRI